MDILDIAVSSISFLTLKEKILFKKNIDTIDKLDVLSIEDIAMLVNRPLTKVVWNGRDTRILAEKGMRLMESQNIQSVRYGDADYPALVTEILNPPYMLFFRGDISTLKKRSVSVVGTRNVCQKTARAAFDFAKNAALDNCVVISGNANGIDSFAHKGALASGCRSSTVAILPCGIDIIVPAGHKAMVGQIIKSGGLLMSEYIPGVPAEKWRFVQRNRLIAALSPATLVVQAPPGSGALITVSFALDYNRDVMFHKAAFCEDAKKISLEKGKRNTSVSAKKVSTCEQYIESGAPVIADYEDYKNVLLDAPGTHSQREGQGLFSFTD